MTKILGLDLGTNSIGFGIVENNNGTFSLVDKGVHIFSEGVKIEKGVENSKAAERTGFRSARKIKSRRRIRKQETLQVLINHGMCPLSIHELNAWRKNKKAYPTGEDFLRWLKTDEERGINPYFFREKARREKITPFELGRAFYHMAQRRGFLSNRLDQGQDEGVAEIVRNELLQALEGENDMPGLTEAVQIALEPFREEEDKAIKTLIRGFEKIYKENETADFKDIQAALKKFLNRVDNLGAVKKGIAELSRKMQEAGCDTLGQYFYKIYGTGEKIRTNYTGREEHYLMEFQKICAMQHLPENLVKELEKAIFFQRPLKSQRGLVGKCTFEKDKSRCPVSHPAFEEYAALQFINSIRMGTSPDNRDPLGEADRQKIWSKFIRKSKPTFDFSEIEDVLTPKGEKRSFNYSGITTVTGCRTIAQLVQVFGPEWKDALYRTYTRKGKKAGEKSVDEVINDTWHALFSFNKKEKLEAWARESFGLDASEARKFSNIQLKREYAALSLKAINKILPHLREGLIYSHAVFLANMGEVIGNEIWQQTENQSLINDAIRSLIRDQNEISRYEGIVNELISDFRGEYYNAEKDHVLDEQDKKEVLDKIHAVLGRKYFEKLPVEKQQEIIGFIEQKYQEQLRKGRGGEFIKRQRVDEKIGNFLADNFDVSPADLAKLYHPADVELFKPPKRAEDGKLYLGSPVVPSIKNPMAMRTMHQLRKLVNTLIREDKIDEDTHVHIELARELNDANKRKAIQDYQRERQAEREEYRKRIKELYREECGKDIEPTDAEILKFQLWIEQGQKCFYTDKTINICNFIGADPQFDIEHTIPKSLSYDNSQQNLTLCDILFNREVKKNRIPTELPNYDDIKPRLERWEKKVEEFEWKYNSRKKAKGIETKEQKDKRIREKHYFKLHLDYWKGKLYRFTCAEVPQGFKNSQLVDTGIITKYSRAYLKSIFSRVETVKGETVAEFRKQWGLQEEYAKKERVNHIHHCIDAITIACMTKDKYDLLAQLYHADEENRVNDRRDVLKALKPWPTFVEDLKQVEHEVLVSHHTPDNMSKQSRKKLRRRGKVVFTTDGRPKIQQGDTARGSLHKDTYYGAIIPPGTSDNKPRYVVRVRVEELTPGDINNIVDKEVREIIDSAVKRSGLKQAIKEGFFMKSGVPVKKVRIYTPSVTDPIHLKKHRDLSRLLHKQSLHVANDSNYVMALYEGQDTKGKLKRDFELVSNMDAAAYYRLSNKEKSLYPLVPESKIINPGTANEYYLPLCSAPASQ